MSNEAPPRTPDGRYILVRGRLWRISNPALSDDRRQKLVDELMDARRAVRDAKDDYDALARARRRVNAAKIGLGERGPGWWQDGSPDFGRHLAKNTPYRNWAAGITGQQDDDDKQPG